MENNTGIILNGTTAKWFLTNIQQHTSESRVIEYFDTLEKTNQKLVDKLAKTKQLLTQSAENNKPLVELGKIRAQLQTILNKTNYYAQMIQQKPHDNWQEALAGIDKLLTAKINMLPALD